VTEFDGPEEVEVESRESDQEGSDDGDGPSTSADGSGTESVADDHVPLDGDGDDEPDRVVTDGVQRRRTQLARPFRQRTHVHAPRLRRSQCTQSYVLILFVYTRTT